MSSVPTDQQLARALGMAVHEVDQYIIRSCPLPIQGCWVLTFSDRTPEEVLRKLRLSNSRTCTVLLTEEEHPLCPLPNKW